MTMCHTSPALPNPPPRCAGLLLSFLGFPGFLSSICAFFFFFFLSFFLSVAVWKWGVSARSRARKRARVLQAPATLHTSWQGVNWNENGDLTLIKNFISLFHIVVNLAPLRLSDSHRGKKTESLLFLSVKAFLVKGIVQHFGECAYSCSSSTVWWESRCYPREYEATKLFGELPGRQNQASLFSNLFFSRRRSLFIQCLTQKWVYF